MFYNDNLVRLYEAMSRNRPTYQGWPWPDPTDERIKALERENNQLRAENDSLRAERDAYRRGQGPAPTPATHGTTALHETHPIPNSRGDDQ